MNCKICNFSSTKFLIDRIDFEYDIDVKLNYYLCNNSSCGHVFSHPIPENSILSSFYNNYTTHSLSVKKTIIERLIYRFRKKTIKEFTKLFDRDCSILDYGSGNGYYSYLMLELKFKNIQAFDFDEKTKLCFKNSDIKFSSREKDITSKTYDIILLNHVIEHVKDPTKLVLELYKLLNKNGILYIRTPNNSSICSNCFKEFWRGWETPRHLNIFSFNSMKNLLKNYRDYDIRTSNQMFLGIFLSSYNYKYTNIRMLKFFLGILLFLFSLFFSRKKEEIVCKIYK